MGHVTDNREAAWRTAVNIAPGPRAPFNPALPTAYTSNLGEITIDVGLGFEDVQFTGCATTFTLSATNISTGTVYTTTGAGPTLTLTGLPAGTYTAQATATNCAGSSGPTIWPVPIDLPAPSGDASGGLYTVINISGQNYALHTFLVDGTFTVFNPITTRQWITAAGGGGGTGAGLAGGGGGSGGQSLSVPSEAIAPGVYSVVVGTGVVHQAGGNSTFNGHTALGGRRGGDTDEQGLPGWNGSGGGPKLPTGNLLGGAGTNHTGGTGINDGTLNDAQYTAGGGAGQAEDGMDGHGLPVYSGGRGGNGASTTITGVSTRYSGGGGGFGATATIVTGDDGGIGGLGGGGKGEVSQNPTVTRYAENGTDNTGGGGGGSGVASGLAGRTKGGSGIVMIRYAIP